MKQTHFKKKFKHIERFKANSEEFQKGKQRIHENWKQLLEFNKHNENLSVLRRIKKNS